MKYVQGWAWYGSVMFDDPWVILQISWIHQILLGCLDHDIHMEVGVEDGDRNDIPLLADLHVDMAVPSEVGAASSKSKGVGVHP